MTERDLSRRSLIQGAAAAGVLLSTAPLLKGERSAHASVWPPSPTDLVFDQNLLVDTNALHASGLRRNSGPTGGYLSGSVAKAQVPAGSPLRVEFPGVKAAVVAPIAGTLPRDEYTVQLDVINDTGVDFATAPFPGAQIFFIANAVMLWRYAANGIALNNFNTGQGVTMTIPAGAWPAGTSQTFTLWVRRSDNVLWLMRGTDFAGRAIAGAPTAFPPVGWPPSGIDDGIQIGGADVASQPFDIANTQIHRYFWPYDTAPVNTPPTVTVNAAATQGAWPQGRGGHLPLYQGFFAVPETQQAIRDQQLSLVLDQAGSQHVRFAGPMQYVGITKVGQNFTYNWTTLDQKIDVLIASRPNAKLHLCLDYCPPILQPVGGNQFSPPTSFSNWATIATAIVGHVKTRYGAKFASCTLWNEPDLSNYWTGTQAQIYSLWSQTQTKLIASHPDKKMGCPEFAYEAGAVNFFNWLAGQSATLKNSVTAIYLHDFQQNLNLLRSHMKNVRTAATNAGVPASVPMRITEYNIRLGQINEWMLDANSWYRTQPEHFLNEYAAAYCLAFVWEALEQDNVDVFSLAATGCAELSWGKQAIVSCTDPVVPYGTWSTLALLNKLSGNRVSATSNWPSVRVLATKNGTTTTLVYSSFKPSRGLVDNQTFAISWSGLPATYTWTHWQYDKDSQSGGKMVVVATGNQTNLPTSVTVGALGIGGIQIV